MNALLRPLAFLLLAALSVPAAAQEATQVPEGSQLTLFALGVLGVLVGRRLSMGRGRKGGD